MWELAAGARCDSVERIALKKAKESPKIPSLVIEDLYLMYGPSIFLYIRYNIICTSICVNHRDWTLSRSVFSWNTPFTLLGQHVIILRWVLNAKIEVLHKLLYRFSTAYHHIRLNFKHQELLFKFFLYIVLEKSVLLINDWRILRSVIVVRMNGLPIRNLCKRTQILKLHTHWVKTLRFSTQIRCFLEIYSLKFDCTPNGLFHIIKMLGMKPVACQKS